MLLMKCCAFNCCFPPQGSAPAHASQSEERALGALVCKQHKGGHQEHSDIPDHPPGPAFRGCSSCPRSNGERATAGSSGCARV